MNKIEGMEGMKIKQPEVERLRDECADASIRTFAEYVLCLRAVAAPEQHANEADHCGD